MAKKLRVLSSFKKDYKKLPYVIQEKVDTQLGFLLENPDHPSLNPHPIRGTKSIWEGYVDYHYRFTLGIDGDFYVLRKVGPHDIIKRP